MKQEAKPWYSDQILPFDITLAGASELGKATAMKIFGVEILNEGSGVSIDDAVTEMQATFVARFVEPWQDQVLRDELEIFLFPRARDGRSPGRAMGLLRSLGAICLARVVSGLELAGMGLEAIFGEVLGPPAWSMPVLFGNEQK